MLRRQELRQRRKKSIRKKLVGTAERPRVFVFKSNKYLYAGVADDEAGTVLFSKKGARKSEDAVKVGKEIAKELKKRNIETVVFDRSGYKYHGILVALVDAVREEKINV